VITPGEHKGIRGYWHDDRFFVATGAVLDLLFPGGMQWIDAEDLAEGQRCHEEMHRCFKAGGDTSGNPRVQALLNHLRATGCVQIDSEVTWLSEKYGYGGTIDGALCQETRKSTIIADWKFAESIDERYHFQLEAYDRMTRSEVRHVLIIFQVTRACKVNPVVVKPDSRHWAYFQNALAVLKFRLR